MTRFAFLRRDTKVPFQPVRFNEFRDLWRDSAALFQFGELHQVYERAPTMFAHPDCVRAEGISPPVGTLSSVGFRPLHGQGQGQLLAA